MNALLAVKLILITVGLEKKTQGKPIIDGIDLWDALLAKDSAPQRNELLHWHGLNRNPQALRSGDWRIVFDPGAGHETEVKATPALYKLSEDLSESKDLAGSHPEITATLTARAKELHATIQADPILPTSKPKPIE